MVNDAVKYDLDIIRQGRASPKLFRLARYSKISKLDADNLRELSILVRTPGFRQADMFRLMPKLTQHLYTHAKNMRFEGDVDMILENARSITRQNARGLTLRLIEGGAGVKGQLPSWCLQELIQTKEEGKTMPEIARELGVSTERVRFWCRSRRGSGGRSRRPASSAVFRVVL